MSAAEPYLLDLLDEEERHRHARFLRAEDRALFLVSHALTRIVAAHHVSIVPTALRYAHKIAAYEKPRFGDPASALQFSVSHSGARVVVAISRAVRLGVDLERIAATEPEAPLLASVLCETELEAFLGVPPPARAWAFCRYWTRKEAVLKATGDGLEISPARIVVTAPTSPAALVRWSGPGGPADSVYLYDLDAAPGYAASLAALSAQLQCSDHDGGALLRSLA